MPTQSRRTPNSGLLNHLAERALLPLLALTAAFSVLAIGAVHTPILLIVAALAALSASSALILARAQHTQTPIFSLPLILLIALALITLLQTIPIPITWLNTIAPTNADIWSRALLPLEKQAPTMASLSLDPGAGTIEALKLAIYAAVFYASTILGAHRGAAMGQILIFASSILAALATLLHGLLGLNQVYGLYQPTFRPSPWHVGPLLNPNNLAGYLNLGIFAGLGLLLMHNAILPPWSSGLGIALLLALTLATGSRAGVIALILGLMLFALLSRNARGSQSARISSRRVLLPAAAALIAGLSLAVLGTGQEAWLELADKDLQKIQHLGRVLPAVFDFAWLGMGRGAFESVYPAYNLTPGHLTYTHAENFILQWCADWGIPIATIALIAFAYAFSPKRLGVTRGAVAAGVFVGFSALLLQNMADLGLEIPALCIACCITLGSLYGDAKRRHLPRENENNESQNATKLIHGPIASLLSPLLAISAFTLPVFYKGLHDLAKDQEELRTRMQEGHFGEASQRKDFLYFLRSAIQRHPAEPYFPLVGALFSWRTKSGDPIPWLQRTLERMPINGRAHLLLADVLNERKAKLQAFMELRMAVENDAALIMPAAQSALRYSLQFEDLLRAAPQGKAGAPLLDAMGEILNAKPPENKALAQESRRRCDEEALMRDPTRLGPRLRQVQMLFDALEHKLNNEALEAQLCANRTLCEHSLEEHARLLEQYAPQSSHALRTRARLYTHQGRADEAERMLSTECNRFSDRGECLKQRVMSAAALSGGDRLNPAVRDYVSASCTKASSCAEAAAWAGKLRADRGEYAASMALYERSVREEANEERLMALAEVSSKAGAHAKAAEALQKVLDKRGGADPLLRKRIDEEKAKAAGILVGP